jgi:CBS domain-containing protein
MPDRRILRQAPAGRDRGLLNLPQAWRSGDHALEGRTVRPEGIAMKLVNHLLEAKGRQVFSIGPDSSVFDAIRIMAEKGIGAVVVMEGERLLGILSERDYARKVIIKGRSSQTTRVAEIMTTEVITASGSNTVNECMNTMTTMKIRHLPVVEDGSVIGIISIGDLVQAIIADQQEAIEHLEHYISG